MLLKERTQRDELGGERIGVGADIRVLGGLPCALAIGDIGDRRDGHAVESAGQAGAVMVKVVSLSSVAGGGNFGPT